MTNCNGHLLHYLDDSGAHDSGYITFTWLALSPERQATAMRQWMAFRTDLYTRYRIPPHARLHATTLVAGYSPASINHGYLTRAAGEAIVREGLYVIASIDGLTVGTVYRRFHRDPTSAKQQLYRALVAHLAHDLRCAATTGTIIIDGDGADHLYADTHHQLDPAISDLLDGPLFRSADHDQWVQMADLAAWSAYQSIVRKRSKRHLWSWYPLTLGRLDPHGPLAL